MTSDALLDALVQLHHAGPEYQGFLANHGPMAAEALTHLGADDAVARWVDGYKARLQEAPTVLYGINEENWREKLGNESLVGDWTAYMRQQSTEIEWRDLLLRWWPRLLPGLGASATHGLIRTAHAIRSLIEAGDRPHFLLIDELAQGLSFWAARYLVLPVIQPVRGNLGAVQAIAKLPRLDQEVEGDGPGLIGRLAVLNGALPTLGEALSQWKAPMDPDIALDHIIASAARVLAARRDAPIAFCHTVTAPAAMRLLLPVLPPGWRPAAIRASWQAVGSIVAAFASPRDEAESRSFADVDPRPFMDDLPQLAVAHGDEHVIKLTEAVLREYQRTSDATLLVAADRFRRRMNQNIV